MNRIFFIIVMSVLICSYGCRRCQNCYQFCHKCNADTTFSLNSIDLCSKDFNSYSSYMNELKKNDTCWVISKDDLMGDDCNKEMIKKSICI